MRNDSRGFERASKVENRRFREFSFMAAEAVVRTLAASSCVKTGSAPPPSVDSSAFAAFRAACRRRCGSSSTIVIGVVAVTGVGSGSSFGNSGIDLAVKLVLVFILPFPTISFRGKKPLFVKYPFRSRCEAVDVVGDACRRLANERFEDCD